MYSPKLYQVTDPERIDSFLHQQSFGALITTDVNNIPFASHLPFEWEIGNGTHRALHCHVSKSNPLWKTVSEKTSVLFIVQGSHAYVSPRWYSHENVPTWNYMVTHIYGKASVTVEPNELLVMVDRLTKKFETTKDYSVHQHSPDFIQSQLKGIVGITLNVTNIEATFKISQNRDEKDFISVIRHLEQSNSTESQTIAQEMSLMQERLFKK